MDTQILLALLEMNTGIGPCLKFLCLFDKGLQKNAKIEDLSVKWQTADSEGKSEIEVEFKNSRAVADIFSKIPKTSCTYVVEITPKIETVRTKALYFCIGFGELSHITQRALGWLNLYGREAVLYKLKNRQKMCVFLRF